MFANMKTEETNQLEQTNKEKTTRILSEWETGLTHLQHLQKYEPEKVNDWEQKEKEWEQKEKEWEQKEKEKEPRKMFSEESYW